MFFLYIFFAVFTFFMYVFLLVSTLFITEYRGGRSGDGIPPKCKCCPLVPRHSSSGPTGTAVHAHCSKMAV